MNGDPTHVLVSFGFLIPVGFHLNPQFSKESHVLSPSEVKNVHPLLRVDDIYGGVYSPGDGTIDPTSICNAYAKAAKAYGGGVYENVAVTWTFRSFLSCPSPKKNRREFSSIFRVKWL